MLVVGALEGVLPEAVVSNDKLTSGVITLKESGLIDIIVGIFVLAMCTSLSILFLGHVPYRSHRSRRSHEIILRADTSI